MGSKLVCETFLMDYSSLERKYPKDTGLTMGNSIVEYSRDSCHLLVS